METEIINLISLGITGTLFSYAIKHIKAIFKLNGDGTRVAVAIGSGILALIFVLLRDTVYWGTFVMIVMTSQTIYGLFLSRNKKRI